MELLLLPAVYSIAGLAILTVARLRWAWSLLPSGSEVVARLGACRVISRYLDYIFLAGMVLICTVSAGYALWHG